MAGNSDIDYVFMVAKKMENITQEHILKKNTIQILSFPLANTRTKFDQSIDNSEYGEQTTYIVS